MLPHPILTTSPDISVNVDGLPIRNSTKKQFWAILALNRNIEMLEKEPFVLLLVSILAEKTH